MSESLPKPARAARVYTRILLDRTVAHGAYRQWHLLRDMAASKGCCWPGQRYIRRKIGCSLNSIKKWTHQLTAAGYLRVENYDKEKHPQVTGKHDGFVYFPLFDTVTETSNSQSAAVISSCALPLHKPVTPTVTKTSNETNSKEPNKREPITKERSSASMRWGLQQKKESIEEVLAGHPCNPEAACYGRLCTPDAKMEYRQFKAERANILKMLATLPA